MISWFRIQDSWNIKFQTIRKVSRSSGKFPDHSESFETIQKLSRSSGKFPDYPETFQAIHKLSKLSRNFPDHPETSQCNFKGYAQKLSGRAKTFWMAMPRWFLCLWIIPCERFLPKHLNRRAWFARVPSLGLPHFFRTGKLLGHPPCSNWA